MLGDRWATIALWAACFDVFAERGLWAMPTEPAKMRVLEVAVVLEAVAHQAIRTYMRFVLHGLSQGAPGEPAEVGRSS